MGLFNWIQDIVVRIRGDSSHLDNEIMKKDSLMNKLESKLSAADIKIQTLQATSFALMNATLANLSTVTEVNEAILAQQVATAAISIANLTALSIANFGNPLGFIYGGLALQMTATQAKAIQERTRAQQLSDYVDNINLYTNIYGG